MLDRFFHTKITVFFIFTKQTVSDTNFYSFTIFSCIFVCSSIIYRILITITTFFHFFYKQSIQNFIEKNVETARESLCFVQQKMSYYSLKKHMFSFFNGYKIFSFHFFAIKKAGNLSVSDFSYRNIFYFTTFSQKFMSIVAAWVLVAFPWGTSVVSVIPWMTSASTAHFIASTAQPLISPASVYADKSFFLLVSQPFQFAQRYRIAANCSLVIGSPRPNSVSL